MTIAISVTIIDDNDCKVQENYVVAIDDSYHSYEIKRQIERFLNKALDSVLSEDYKF